MLRAGFNLGAGVPITSAATVGVALGRTDLVRFMEILLCSPVAEVDDMSMVVRLVASSDKATVGLEYSVVGRFRRGDIWPP